ncbi:hypothetical protein SKAU_G00404720 [Synaphobranchus kaupii]|uniref:Uncharacterized protein n=1 Tax=Synaphobranchus kaupii TaxID=118154 RepID=A0A9Q1E9Q3_SYNKA|nr:hypothetical protein SKAU_G00404720 [Synaphobranchus kaupii]
MRHGRAPGRPPHASTYPHYDLGEEEESAPVPGPVLMDSQYRRAHERAPSDSTLSFRLPQSERLGSGQPTRGATVSRYR